LELGEVVCAPGVEQAGLLQAVSEADLAAFGSLLFAHGKSLKRVQGWLRHSQLTTTMNAHIDQVDDGPGSADAWDEILAGGPAEATFGATRHPEPAAKDAV
jgi:hypothetical protein